MKDVNKEDYDKCVQDYPNCGETVLERSNKLNERDKQAKKTTAGRRRSKTKKGAMRRKRMTKRRQLIHSG